MEEITHGRAGRERGDLIKRAAAYALQRPSALMQGLRARWQLRNCTQVGLTVRLRGRVLIETHGTIHVGERVRMSGRLIPIEMVAWRGASIEIGDGTFINYAVSISAHRQVRIGADCQIGTYVMIMDSDYHDLQDLTRPGEALPVQIGDRVWLGNRAIVLKGVTIGEGAVVGAGSVVTTDLPPRCLAAGVPARVIRML